MGGAVTLLKEAIGTGETVVLAQEDACKTLGVETHEAQFEILQMPSKKVLGVFGGKLAQVRAYIEVNPSKVAVKYIKGILKAMDLDDVEISVEESEGEAIINLNGDNVRYIIGRHGETLDAIQYLSGLVCNHSKGSYYRVKINTGNYREKREKTLESLGIKMAKKAVKTGRLCVLEPMNPYDRRIIHTAVQAVTGAVSWSEGEDLNRHVVIGVESRAMKRGKRDFSKKPFKSDASHRVNSKDIKMEKDHSHEREKTPLYGKIDINN